MTVRYNGCLPRTPDGRSNSHRWCRVYHETVKGWCHDADLSRSRTSLSRWAMELFPTSCQA